MGIIKAQLGNLPIPITPVHPAACMCASYSQQLYNRAETRRYGCVYPVGGTEFGTAPQSNHALAEPSVYCMKFDTLFPANLGLNN